ncbi:Rieske (2Fe-2S) domain protein [Acidimicrobium ferrooxidans DSM 10331]|uniref:Rieske (2Fe-2S) domain protein n=1 Tax=Acidimicrobium ferrooxidans (strain DSM 10331 / JCM 15462 / NBRC 103882 / ICP) TaxID=525909 RepID=C7LYV8_ACIFD|nr:Rieske (2Fe-2S) protein [Acidimicrobium ferrooxidans]ACU53916.1 Rieske (2Fe-2S) domain protein [Acidimicrobium ferrooxidans DSM 10331]
MLSVAVVGDEGVVARVVRAASPFGWEVTSDLGAADVVVVPAGDPEALRAVGARRARGEAIVAIAYVAEPDQLAWRAAERGGADRVVNVGALTKTLREVLGDPSRGVRRLVVGHVEDVAGRLGLVGEVEIDGASFMVLRVEGRWVCLEATCPHQGARLAGVPCEEGVLTCPAHGSQFSCESGERVRGPADRALRSLAVVVEGSELVVRGGGVG